MGLWCLFAHGSRTAFRHWRVLHFWPRGLMDKASDFGSGDWALSRPVVVFFILFAVFSSFFAFLFLFLFLFFVCCEKRSPLSRRSFLRILSHSSTLFFFSACCTLVVVATLLRLAEDATSGTEPMLALLLPSAISSAGGLDWIDDTPWPRREFRWCQYQLLVKLS